MRGIFFRHVLRDISLSTLTVLLVLLVVLFAWQVAFVLGRAADGQLPGTLVLQLVMLTLRGNLTVILPFAVVLGITLGLGRLYHDSEITAAHAGGVGAGTLFAAAGVVILAAAAVAAWAAFVDGPGAARGAVRLRTEALRTAVTRGLAPGQFRSLGHGVTLYFRSADADGALRDVFMQRDLPATGEREGRMQIVLADRARYAVSADNSYYAIDMDRGYSYEGRAWCRRLAHHAIRRAIHSHSHATGEAAGPAARGCAGHGRARRLGKSAVARRAALAHRLGSRRDRAGIAGGAAGAARASARAPCARACSGCCCSLRMPA